MSSSPAHFVKLYHDDSALAGEVAAFARDAFAQGHAFVLAVPAPHAEAVRSALAGLALSPTALEKEGRLTVLDADETLAQITVHRWPDQGLYESVIGRLIEEKHARFGGVSAHGELVDVLWQAGSRLAAVRLEELWNDLGKRIPFRLSCAYRIDLLDSAIDVDDLHGVCRTHAAVRSSHNGKGLDAAFERAASEVLTPSQADMFRFLSSADVEGRFPAGAGYGIMWLRRNVPEIASRLLERARLHYSIA